VAGCCRGIVYDGCLVDRKEGEGVMKKFKKIIERVLGFLWVMVPITILNKSPEDADIAYLIFGVPLWIMIIYAVYGYIRKKMNKKKDQTKDDEGISTG